MPSARPSPDIALIALPDAGGTIAAGILRARGLDVRQIASADIADAARARPPAVVVHGRDIDPGSLRLDCGLVVAVGPAAPGSAVCIADVAALGPVVDAYLRGRASGRSPWPRQEEPPDALRLQPAGRDVDDAVGEPSAAVQNPEAVPGAGGGGPEARWDFDPGRGTVRLSAAFEAQMGLAEGTLQGDANLWFGRIHDEDRERVLGALMSHVTGSTSHFEAEYQLRHQDNSWRIVLARGSAVRGDDGRVLSVTGTQTDITGRKRAEQLLRRTLQDTEERFKLVGRGAADGLWDWDLSRDVIHYSPRWKEMIGYSDHEIRTSPDEWSMRLHVADRERVKGELTAHLEGRRPVFRCEYRLRHRDGSFRFMVGRAVALRDASGKAVRLAGSQSDVTEQKLAEERLLHEALHDPLTRLPNRALFLDRLRQALARLRRHPGSGFTVLFLDLDRFGLINDGLGHPAGDQALIEIGQRLAAGLRGADTVARFGGDEFTLLLDGVDDPAEAIHVAERLQQAVEQPMTIDGQSVHTSASAGIAIALTGNEKPEDLLRDADTAMYGAKIGQVRQQIFDAGMRAQVAARLKIEGELRAALEADQVPLVWHAVVELRTGAVSGLAVEATWTHTERGAIEPREIARIAHEAGLGAALDRLYLSRVCRLLGGGSTPLAADFFVSVPILRLLDASLSDDIARLTQAAGISPALIALSVPEHTLMAPAEELGPALERLRALGLRLHVAGFGSGLVPLAALHRLPFDGLALDGDLVAALDTASGRDVAGTVLALARKLGRDALANGVATAFQRETMGALGCRWASGPLFPYELSDEAAARLAIRPAGD